MTVALASNASTQDAIRSFSGGDSSCNLIVNYLPLSYRERHLSKLFSKIGEIKSCRVMRFVQDGRTLSKGYGFVKYHTIDAAIQAIQTLNGQNVLGKKIKVSFARPSAQRTRSNLFVSQIPKRWTSEELKDFFAPFGNIIESRVLRTETGESRRCGFVRFDNDEQAEESMTKLNCRRPTFNDVPIRVRIATQHEKNKPTKNKMNVEKLNKIHNLEAENLALPLQEVLKNSNITESQLEQCDELTSLQAMPIVAPISDHLTERARLAQQNDKSVLYLEPAPEIRKPNRVRHSVEDDHVFSRRLVLKAPPMRSSERILHDEFRTPLYMLDRFEEPTRGFYDEEKAGGFQDFYRPSEFDFQRRTSGERNYLSKRDPTYLDYPRYPEPPSHPGAYDEFYRREMSLRDPYQRYESPHYDAPDYPPRSNTTDVHIVNLPLSMNSNDVHHMCSQYGRIAYMHMPCDPSGRPYGMAFVSFEGASSAKFMIQQLNGQLLGRNRIQVSLVQK